MLDPVGSSLARGLDLRPVDTLNYITINGAKPAFGIQNPVFGPLPHVIYHAAVIQDFAVHKLIFRLYFLLLFYEILSRKVATRAFLVLE